MSSNGDSRESSNIESNNSSDSMLELEDSDTEDNIMCSNSGRYNDSYVEKQHCSTVTTTTVTTTTVTIPTIPAIPAITTTKTDVLISPTPTTTITTTITTSHVLNYSDPLMEEDKFKSQTTEFKMGKYTIIETLGSGYFGTTYHVNFLGKDYALKHILCESKQTQNTALQEASALGKIHSKYVVSFEETFLLSDGVAIVMQYCPGGNLENLVKCGNLANDRICEIFYDVTNGLQAMHILEMVHRDIKPDNLLLLDNGHVLIGDLGLTRTINNYYKSGTGYFWYKAPEVAFKAIYTKKSDIWSLGCVLFSLLSGKLMEDRNRIFAKLSSNQLNQIICNELHDSPKNLVDCVHFCLDLNEKNRPQTSELITIISPMLCIKTLHRDTTKKVTVVKESLESKLIHLSEDIEKLENCEKEYVTKREYIKAAQCKAGVIAKKKRDNTDTETIRKIRRSIFTTNERTYHTLVN